MTTNRRTTSPRWQTDLAEIVQTAVKPLTDEMKEMRVDIQSLKENRVVRADVYDRQVMDEKLSKLTGEIESQQKALLAMKEFVWKALGGAGTIVVILVYFKQYLLH